MTNENTKAVFNASAQEVPAYFNHGHRWYVLFTFALINALTLFLTMSVAGIGPRVMMELGIDSSEFSFLTSVTYLNGFLTCLFFGSFVDRFGQRNVLLAGLLLGAIGCVLRAMVPEYWAFALGNFIIGFTFSTVNAAVVKSLGAWFSPMKFNTAIGVYISCGSLAAAIGMASGALFPSTEALLWFCLAFVAVAIVVTFFMKNRPEDAPEDLASENILPLLGNTLKYKEVWAAAIVYLVLYGASNAGNIFMVVGLQAAKGVAPDAASITSMIGVAGCIFGCLILPAITSKIGSAKPALVAYALLCALCLAGAWLLPYGVQTTVLLFAQAFFIGGLLSGTKSLPGQIPSLPVEYRGTAGGFQACLQNLGAFVIPTFILAPIAGNDFILLYMLVVAVLVIYAVLVLMLPKGMGHTK